LDEKRKMILLHSGKLSNIRTRMDDLILGSNSTFIGLYSTFDASMCSYSEMVLHY
jgi:hypothetical protein